MSNWARSGAYAEHVITDPARLEQAIPAVREDRMPACDRRRRHLWIWPVRAQTPRSRRASSRRLVMSNPDLRSPLLNLRHAWLLEASLKVLLDFG